VDAIGGDFLGKGRGSLSAGPDARQSGPGDTTLS